MSKLSQGLVGICLLVLATAASASTTGAITGTVSDASGRPLAGATVMIAGTPFGTFTNGEGEYYIGLLAPGSYSVMAQMVGMAATTIEGVSVVSDQTSRIDMILNESVVGETVFEVVGQRNLILENVPSTIHVVDRSEIETMPVASILDVIQRQAGISSQGGELHVRGGRSGEVAFLLDGVSVRSPVTNAFVSVIPLSAIAEASTTTGGFDAEYGNALSGIVKMVVREGGRGFEADADFGYGGMTAFGSENEQRNYSQSSENDNYRGACLNGELSAGGPEPFSTYLLPAIGIRLPGEVRWFGACEWSRSGFDLEDSRGNWENNWQNNLSGCMNLTWHPEPVTNLGFLGRYSYRQSGWDEWAWSRYDQPAYVGGEPYLGGTTDYALPIRFDETWGMTASATRMFGGSSILEILGDRSEFCQWRRIRDEEGGYVGEGLTPAAWFGEFFPDRAADSLGFYHAGIHPSVWLESRSSVTSGRIGLTSQVSRTLKLKAGIEGSYYDIYDFSVTANGPGQTWVSNWKAYPSSGAAYLQSTADFSGAMVLNTGLRLDLFHANTRMVTPGETGSEAVPVKVQLSPRVGMTHPISDRDVFFVTYGHYFQMPSLNQMFSGTNYNLSGDFSIVGNPDLDAVRTISMEAGVRHRLGDLSTIAFSAFSKQISGLVQTTPVSAEGLDFFFMYENDDSYATVQGAELTILRLPGRMWSGSASYTFSIAEGRYSSATEQYEYSAGGYSTLPEDDNYLDWDQRHTASAHLCMTVDRGEGPAWGGIRPFEDLMVSLDWSWGSGFPFSPVSGDSIPVINTLRYPFTMQTDLSASRRFRTGPVELEAKVTVYNLFDRADISRIYDPAVYLETGDPGGILSNPSAYFPARHLFASLGIHW